MCDDLKALSDFIGKKKYLFGDKPSEMDCAIFGQLAQMLWQSYGNQSEKALKGFPNLCDYCERMKETIWPDWEKCTTRVKSKTNMLLSSDEIERKVYPKDTVILHQIGRGPWAPSLSPFAMKLETYLRMATK
ncbi:hypothetical protein KUTeg_019521 [Tegillarca granosa]|uniref:Metaxin glutathione S-transferase domain-containing protein n=1 Tax=Tegillarca granosa TaxID=220873 RepID=A0ABQ9ED70_TEGGR|nr:hypothetical protein KUTeg_019521 [Tegillarca granosa]